MSDSQSLTTTSSSSIATLNVLNLVAYIANVGLVNGVPSLLNLPDNAEVSAKYQTLVTPAGWAFAIWGLIFLMQAIWSIVQIAVPAARSNPQVLEGVGKKYISVCFFQAAWTFAFGYEQMTLSMAFMLGILYYLYKIYKAQQGVADDQDDDVMDNNASSSSNAAYWLFQFPFGLHLGWIVAASLVNANLVLVAYGASASFMYAAAITTVLLAFGVASFTLYTESQKEHSPTVVIPVVLVWALVSISCYLLLLLSCSETNFLYDCC